MDIIKRRKFLRKGIQLSVTAGIATSIPFFESYAENKKMFFKISLAEWSLHKALFAGEFTNLDFPRKAKNDFGIDAVEYVNQFFKDKAENGQYLNDLNTRCKDNGVKSVLIMIDGEGHLAELDTMKRVKAVENHYKWIDAAKFLGCHSIRVNAAGRGSYDDVQKAAIEGLGKLSEYGEKEKINVIVENHGGLSSNGEWLTAVMEGVNNKYCGTLPDFGNFIIDRREGISYDRYKGVRELMPYAKGVSAKSHVFDEEGYERNIDYRKMLKIVKDAGFKGYVGIEYEGEGPEDEGILATKKLLVRLGNELS
ncbi:sugar phosphate isomerase/epimerase family protein [Bacteroidota bacterium]